MTREKIIRPRPAPQADDPARSAGQTPPEWNGRPTPADAAHGLMYLAEWLQSEAAFCWRAMSNALQGRLDAADRAHAANSLGPGLLVTRGWERLVSDAAALHEKCAQLAQDLAQLGPGPIDPAAVYRGGLVGGRLAAEVGDLVSRVRAAVGPP